VKFNKYQEAFLPKMPAHWSGGSQPPRSTFKFSPLEGYVRLIQIRDYKSSKHATYIPANSTNKFCDVDDVMIGRYGPPNFQILRGLKGAYNVALIKAIPNEELEKDYLFYYLKQQHLFEFIDVRAQRSAGQDGIEMDELRAYPFPLPPIEERRTIVAILSSFDRSIEFMTALITAKQRCRKAYEQQLLTGIVRYKEFVTSSDTQSSHALSTPFDWSVVPIEEFANEVSMKAVNNQPRAILSCTKYDGLVDSLEYFGRRVYSDDTSNYKLVKRGQFAYATNHIEEGSIGFLKHRDEGLVSPMYTVFEVSGDVIPEYLFSLFKSDRYLHLFRAMTNGSVNRRGGLRWSDFKTIKVALPSKAEQLRIVELLKLIDHEIVLLKKLKQTTEKQKRGIMERLLTGEVTIPSDFVERLNAEVEQDEQKNIKAEASAKSNGRKQ